MKKLLLILVVILTAFAMSACQTREEPTNLDTYDYLMVVKLAGNAKAKILLNV